MLMRMVHHQSRQQIPTAIMEIIIYTIPMMKSSGYITIKLAEDLHIARKRLILRKRRKRR